MHIRNVMSAAVLGALSGLIAEGYYAGHRPLPSFGNLDPSVEIGHAGAAPVSIVALGDSTITGPGLLDPAETWIRQALERVTRDVWIHLTSVATGGAKASDVRRHQLQPALGMGAHIALVSVGSNDAIRGVPPAIFRSELRVIVDALCDSGAYVGLAGIGDLGTIPRLAPPLAQLLRARSARFERIHAEVAQGNPRVVKIPIRVIATEPFRTRPGMFSPDLFHPSELGHAIWADAAHPTLARLIDQVLERNRECAD